MGTAEAIEGRRGAGRQGETQDAWRHPALRGERGARTVIDHHRDGALGSDLYPKRLEGLCVSSEGACKVTAADDNRAICASSSGLLAQFNCFSCRASACASDDGHGSEPSVIEGGAGGFDEGDTFAVRQVVCLAHGAGDNGSNARLSKAENM